MSNLLARLRTTTTTTAIRTNSLLYHRTTQHSLLTQKTIMKRPLSNQSSARSHEEDNHDHDLTKDETYLKLFKGNREWVSEKVNIFVSHTHIYIYIYTPIVIHSHPLTHTRMYICNPVTTRQGLFQEFGKQATGTTIHADWMF